MTYKTALSVHAFVELFPASVQQIALQKLKKTVYTQVLLCSGLIKLSD